MKKLFQIVRKIVVEKIVKSDGSDDAIVPTRGFIITLIFFCAFTAQLILRIWGWYMGYVVYPEFFNPVYKSAWYNLTLSAFILDIVALISGVLLYLSFPVENKQTH